MNEFVNDYISINQNGIDLIRNNYYYKHINYSEIESVEITKGHAIKGWKVICCIGIIIIILAIYMIIKTYPNIDWTSYIRGYFLTYFSLIFFMLFGVFLFYRSIIVESHIKILLKDQKKIVRPLTENRDQILLIISILKALDVKLDPRQISP